MQALAHLRHVLTQLPQAQAQPLDQQQWLARARVQGHHALPQVVQAHPQQTRPCTQALAPGVPITYDCQHKCCLCPGVCAAGAVIAVQVLDEVLLPTVLHKVHLQVVPAVTLHGHLVAVDQPRQPDKCCASSRTYGQQLLLGRACIAVFASTCVTFCMPDTKHNCLRQQYFQMPDCFDREHELGL